MFDFKLEPIFDTAPTFDAQHKMQLNSEIMNSLRPIIFVCYNRFRYNRVNLYIEMINLT
jgi:hypothetical protein